MSGNKITRFTAPIKKGKNEHKDLTVVILAGLAGHNTKSFGPKCLFKLPNGKTILQHQVDTIQGISRDIEIITTVGYSSEKVLKNIPQGVRVVENQLYDYFNTAEEIRLAFNNTLNKRILVLHDDVIFNETIVTDMIGKESSILVDGNSQLDSRDIGVTVVDEYATIFSYGLKHKWMYATYLVEEEVQAVKNVVGSRDKGKLYFFEILNVLLEKNHKICAVYDKDSSATKIYRKKEIDGIDI